MLWVLRRTIMADTSVLPASTNEPGCWAYAGAREESSEAATSHRWERILSLWFEADGQDDQVSVA
jgi:hypothetical protein